MANSDYRVKASQGIFGGILTGLNEGFEDINKNNYKRDSEIEKRRFEIAKMQARQDFTAQQNQNRFQNIRQSKDMAEEAKMKEQFPDQYVPRRAATMEEMSGGLSPEALASANQFNRKIQDERSRRLKVKEDRGNKNSAFEEQIAAMLLSKNQTKE